MSLSINVDLGRILSNLSLLKNDAKDKLICPVVKADAYGHGAVKICKEIEYASDCFAVATASEGIALVKCGIKKPVLVLAPSFDDIPSCIEYGLRIGVGSYEQMKMISSLAGGSEVGVHVQIDTGMHRLGFSSLDELERAIQAEHTGLRIEGVYTHIFSAKSFDEQIARYKPFEELVKSYCPEAVSHTSSSAYTKISYGDMIRPGLALYGYPRDRFLPAMRVESHVLAVKDIEGYSTCGYNGVFKAGKQARRVATVEGGYADGVPRRARGIAGVLHCGEILPIVSVCMDSVSVLVGDSKIKCGDKVCFVGESEGVEQYFDDLAESLSTIPYELMTGIGKRSIRSYNDFKA